MIGRTVTNNNSCGTYNLSEGCLHVRHTPPKSSTDVLELVLQQCLTPDLHVAVADTALTLCCLIMPAGHCRQMQHLPTFTTPKKRQGISIHNSVLSACTDALDCRCSIELRP